MAVTAGFVGGDALGEDVDSARLPSDDEQAAAAITAKVAAANTRPMEAASERDRWRDRRSDRPDRPVITVRMGIPHTPKVGQSFAHNAGGRP